MFMKLAMGLICKEQVRNGLNGSRKAYHTLIESKNHFQNFHKEEYPIILNDGTSGVSNVKVSTPPKYQEYIGICETSPKKCEDCLRCQFN